MKKSIRLITFVMVILLVVGTFVFYLSLKHKEGTNQTVAYINQVAIDQREFNLFLNQVKANVSNYFKQKYNADDSPSFWTTNFQGEVPIERAKQAALEQIKKLKVQQIMAKEYGLLEDLSYQSFLDKLSKENLRRKEAVKNKRVIYGPQQYDELGYYNYLFSNIVIQLKMTLGEKEWSLSDQEIRNRYEELKEQFYKKPDDVKVLKIILPFSDAQGNLDETKKVEAKANMDQIKRRLDKGELFEEVNQSLLKDDSWKWDIGVEMFNEENSRRDMDSRHQKMLAEALKLSIGQISGVFEIDPNSYGLIKIVERKAVSYAPFDEVKDNVKQKINDEKYEEKVKKTIDEAKVELVDHVYQKIRMQ